MNIINNGINIFTPITFPIFEIIWKVFIYYDWILNIEYWILNIEYWIFNWDWLASLLAVSTLWFENDIINFLLKIWMKIIFWKIFIYQTYINNWECCYFIMKTENFDLLNAGGLKCQQFLILWKGFYSKKTFSLITTTVYKRHRDRISVW